MEFIQNLLTDAITFTAAAGFCGMVLQYSWKKTMGVCSWQAPYATPTQAAEEVQTIAPVCTDATPELIQTTQSVVEDAWEEVATTEPQPAPEIPAITDPWEAPITSSTRRWVSRQPQPIDLNALDAATLRKLCTQHGIAWRDVRGKNRHATKAMMIHQLNQESVA
jgi:hypothetical protein